MNLITDLFATPYQFWLVLGGILLVAELLGTSGYLLWSGISAIVIGAIVWLIPAISWNWQWVLFAALTVCIAAFWWYWLRSKRSNDKASQLNKPYQEFIGRQCVLTEPLVNGYGRVKVGDSSWRVKGSQNLDTGTVVEIIDIDSNTFIVKAVN